MNPVTANPHWPISSPENSGSQWLPTQSTSYHLWSPVTMGVIRGLSECASLSPCICLLLFASFLFVSLSLSVHVCPPSLLLCLSFFLSIPVSLGWKEPERERESLGLCSSDCNFLCVSLSLSLRSCLSFFSLLFSFLHSFSASFFSL